MKTTRVLIVDDEVSMQFTLKEVLAQEGYVVDVAGDGFAALAKVESFSPQVVVCDYSMPKMNGLELLRRLRAKSPDLIVIMMTAYGTEEIAVEAMKAGAVDYFAKPFDNKEMLLRIAKAAERLTPAPEGKQARPAAGGAAAPETQLLWRSKPMADIDRLIGQVAGTDVTVLITGESGTGKELVATSVHQRSLRRDRPFVKLNCAALPESLIESELFGYDQGAFTGAVSQRKGRFEQAHGGTIFLDEIGDMTISTQTKVLRVLQERSFERLGGQRTVQVDVRVIAATHQDLTGKIAKNEFREDLFYRLNVVSLRLPALRERIEDLELLANHFVKLYGERFGRPVKPIPAEVLERMRAYGWPGNVRELENSVARAVVLDSFDKVVPVDAPRDGAAGPAVALLPPDLFRRSYKEAKAELIEAFERKYLLGMLERAGGNVSRAAKLAGMHRKNFWEKVRRFHRDGLAGRIVMGEDEEGDAPDAELDAGGDEDGEGEGGPAPASPA